MLHATISAKNLTEILDSVTLLTDECRIQIKSDFVQIPVVHPSDAAQANIKINSEAFEEYEAEEMEICLKLEMLEKIVEIADKNSQITIDIDEPTEKLNIESEGQKYEIGLINGDYVNQRLRSVEVELRSEVTIERSVFNRAIVSAEMISDEIRFKSNEEDGLLTLEAKGDINTTRCELRQENLSKMNIRQCTSIFSLELLSELNRAIPADTDVRIEFDQNRPGRFYYNIANGHGKVEYLLSPRIKAN